MRHCIVFGHKLARPFLRGAAKVDATRRLAKRLTLSASNYFMVLLIQLKAVKISIRKGHRVIGTLSKMAHGVSIYAKDSYARDKMAKLQRIAILADTPASLI
jgi:hypothetical protein